jgi:hypothetical protein
MTQCGIQVCVRFRPKNERETVEEAVPSSSSAIAPWKYEITGPQSLRTITGAQHEVRDWAFDHVFASDSRQEDVYTTTAKRCIE